MTVKEVFDYILTQMTAEQALMKLLEGGVRQYKSLRFNDKEEGKEVHPLIIVTMAAADMQWNYYLEGNDQQEDIEGLVIGTLDYIERTVISTQLFDKMRIKLSDHLLDLYLQRNSYFTNGNKKEIEKIGGQIKGIEFTLEELQKILLPYIIKDKKVLMTKKEAIKLSQEARIKITHPLFLRDEWICVREDTIFTEEGYNISSEVFWVDRDNEIWNRDWIIYIE